MLRRSAPWSPAGPTGGLGPRAGAAATRAPKGPVTRPGSPRPGRAAGLRRRRCRRPDIGPGTTVKFATNWARWWRTACRASGLPSTGRWPSLRARADVPPGADEAVHRRYARARRLPETADGRDAAHEGSRSSDDAVRAELGSPETPGGQHAPQAALPFAVAGAHQTLRAARQLLARRPRHPQAAHPQVADLERANLATTGLSRSPPATWLPPACGTRGDQARRSGRPESSSEP